jgi:hypothetical protein
LHDYPVHLPIITGTIKLHASNSRLNPGANTAFFGFQNTSARTTLKPSWDDYELLAISRNDRISGPIFNPINVL